jgi:methylenetetrahydrofolate reductase (NADPH)
MRIRDRLVHKRPIFSFEFFPPKTEKGEQILWRSLERLALLEPDFVSVTYGAGGGTRARTLEVVGRIKRDLGIEPMAHLTCVGAQRDELARILDQLAGQGIENVLALRGDPPAGEEKFTPTPGGFAHADEFIAFIRERWDFCVGAACYPEVHPEAPDAETDLRHTVGKVEAGAEFLITQLFFDPRVFFDFEVTKMCGASIPEPLRERLAEVEDDPQEVFWTGVSWAARQCRALLRPVAPDAFARPPAGVVGIHFYTLNRSPAARAIFEVLQLAPLGVV